MNGNLLKVLDQITAQYGEDALAGSRRLESLFGDLAKDDPKPLRMAFCRAVDEGAYNALKTAPDEGERASRKTSIAQRVRDEHGIDTALSIEALDILDAALFGEENVAQTQAPPDAQGIIRFFYLNAYAFLLLALSAAETVNRAFGCVPRHFARAAQMMKAGKAAWYWFCRILPDLLNWNRFAGILSPMFPMNCVLPFSLSRAFRKPCWTRRGACLGAARNKPDILWRSLTRTP
jgi:hypothetical protein